MTLGAHRHTVYDNTPTGCCLSCEAPGQSGSCVSGCEELPQAAVFQSRPAPLQHVAAERGHSEPGLKDRGPGTLGPAGQGPELTARGNAPAVWLPRATAQPQRCCLSPHQAASSRLQTTEPAGRWTCKHTPPAQNSVREREGRLLDASL